MEKKDKQSFEAVLSELKNYLLRFGAELDGLQIMVDYERAAIVAFPSSKGHPNQQKVSREALQRRGEIAAVMRTFEEQYRAHGVTRVDAEAYCRNMANYVTDKAF
ncbi:unnamed protein product [Cylicocyclus nassatus]|uniref:Uncharacterized protein n=1 Tax=Cylicocyclus nassatus TaxID=53992 RepID=A0AA36MAS1_CYLNA|nr:unnamed protein product [Cylicocyclus nassatus]CAJ0603633.1 unnamed protein product [Cylicocyclus nassatus]